RPGDAGPKEILVLVNRAGLHHRKDEIAREFLAQIVDVKLGSAGLQRLFAESLEFFLLPDVRAKGDHFRLVFFLDPREQDRRVESARICQHNFHAGQINGQSTAYAKRKIWLLDTSGAALSIVSEEWSAAFARLRCWQAAELTLSRLPNPR